jgi:hypothetical protein
MGVDLVVEVGVGLKKRKRVSIRVKSGAKEVKRGRQEAYTK